MITELTNWQILAVTGEDAASFLQGQLTCDIDKIDNKEARLGAHCNLKGRMVSLFYITGQDNAYSIFLPAELATIALNALKKYALFNQVIIECDADNKLYVTDKATHDSISSPNKNYQFIVGVLDANANDEHAWHLSNIQQGIPRLYASTSEQFLPHEINLPALGGVSFEKGCYLGQEIIARMEHVAKLKKHMYPLMLDTQTAIMPNDKIFVDEKSKRVVGYVVDAINSEDHIACLALLNDQEKDNVSLVINKQEFKMKPV